MNGLRYPSCGGEPVILEPVDCFAFLAFVTRFARWRVDLPLDEPN